MRTHLMAPPYRFVALLLILPLAFAPGTVAAAAEAAPLPHFKHQTITGYVPGMRIQVEARIEHGAAIRTVRCYFRAKHEGDFSYLELVREDATPLYKGFIPAPGGENPQFEYLFLVVDKENRVYKSPVFKAQAQAAKKGGLPFTVEDAPRWQTTDSHRSIALHHEVPGVSAPAAGVWSDPHIAASLVRPQERFGLAADLYPPQRSAGVENASGGRFAGVMEHSAGPLGLGPLAWTGIGVGAAAAVGALLAAGGGGGGGGGGSSEPQTPTEPPIGPDLNGEWSGQLRLVLQGTTQPVSATITHEGNRVSITTSASSTIGRAFSGTITSGGEMRVRDAFDNELWTTYFEPASTHFVRIADFITPTDDRLNVLTLAR